MKAKEKSEVLDHAQREGSSVPAVERATRILDYLSSSGPASLSEIHRALGINKSTVHGILGTLAAAGLAERQGDGARWVLGFKTLELGMAYYKANPFVERFTQVAEQLARQSGESVYYAVLRGTNALILHSVAGATHSLTVDLTPGSLAPAHASALGKALLSGLDEAAIRDLYADVPLAVYTKKTIRYLDGLVRAAAEVRDRGWAVDEGEYENGVCGVAAPVSDAEGAVAAAIEVAIPSSRMGMEKLEALSVMVTRAAAELSGVRGLPPPWARG